jgi:hypothetical protein
MAAIALTAGFLVEQPTILSPRVDFRFLPVCTVEQAKHFLLSNPLPPPGCYLLHRIPDHPFAPLACSRFIVNSEGINQVIVDRIGIDPGNGLLARCDQTGKTAATYLEPHWRNVNEIFEAYGRFFLMPPRIFENQIARQSELSSVGLFTDEEQIRRARASLATADPGTFFISSHPGQETSLFTINIQGSDLWPISRSISITPCGKWLIWNHHIPDQEFANFREMALALGLKDPLQRWETAVEHKQEDRARLTRAVDTSGRWQQNKCASLAVNALTLPYDSDFLFSRAL